MPFKRSYLLGTTVLAGVLAAAAPSFAQEAFATSPQATEVGEIVVTGSRIRRDPTNTPTPLIQVDREAILTTGQSTVIDYLATIPALGNSVVPADTTGSNLGDGGLSLPNLRSLGSGRTLTLINGRRQVGSSGGSLAVDIDTIPRLLIQNIEIVTGGASSVYGADAVSGVLNFILREDFEGIEIDANLGQINSGGQMNKRISALVGGNFFDDRLNVWAHAEYEDIDEVTSNDIKWLNRAPTVIGLDADPTTAPYDGILDSRVYTGLNRIDRPRWGQTTLANNQQPSPTSNPNIPYGTGSSSCNFAGIGSFTYAAGCYAVNPGKTFWYDGTNARLANFGDRVGNTGANRPYNYGGDGVNPADFSSGSRTPESTSSRFAAGGTFKVTDNIKLYGDAKYIKEETYDAGQPTFFDVDLVNSYGVSEENPIYAANNFDLRYSDNAFLPQLVKDAIAGNQYTNYGAPTSTTPGAPGATVIAPLARHSMFGPSRTQENERELIRVVGGIRGDFDQVGFVKDLSWDIGYTYGQVEVVNRERGVDSRRFAYAADAIVDTAGVAGTAGSIVCRIQVLDALGQTDLGDTAYGRSAIDQCAPLNIFGVGNQSAEALEYVDAAINVTERNEQHQAIASVSGNLWDLWGAGPIGVALGAEYRKEYTEAVGRDRDTAGREWLFLNSGADFLGAGYESKEIFGELSIPLFRDSFLGEYAELSGSYRYADYTTVGGVDVYGVNLVYRPIQDITFKTSYNSSVRVPDLGEQFSPYNQTFGNGFNVAGSGGDACRTSAINAAGLDATIRENRIRNCTALAAQAGLAFDFAGATETQADDFRPNYNSGVAGVSGGNPALTPEESTSFTFSTVLRPRFFPNFSLVIDYFNIEIENVINTVAAATASANCVNGNTLNELACASIIRNNAADPFAIGAPAGDPIGGFIEQAFNYAKLKTSGVDFNARYSLDLQDSFGWGLGRIDASIAGTYLIEQKQYLNSLDPSFFTDLTSDVGYPHVRFSSQLTYSPTEALSVNWTMDWQSSQDLLLARSFILNGDSRPAEYIKTGNFMRHDLTVRWNVSEQAALRFGVVNLFDEEQSPWLGTTVYSNYDAYGRRYFAGVNYRF